MNTKTQEKLARAIEFYQSAKQEVLKAQAYVERISKDQPNSRNQEIAERRLEAAKANAEALKWEAHNAFEDLMYLL